MPNVDTVVCAKLKDGYCLCKFRGSSSRYISVSEFHSDEDEKLQKVKRIFPLAIHSVHEAERGKRVYALCNIIDDTSKPIVKGLDYENCTTVFYPATIAEIMDEYNVKIVFDDYLEDNLDTSPQHTIHSDCFVFNDDIRTAALQKPLIMRSLRPKRSATSDESTDGGDSGSSQKSARSVSDSSENEQQDVQINEFIPGVTRTKHEYQNKELESVQSELENARNRLESEKLFEINKEIDMIEKDSHPLIASTLEKLESNLQSKLEIAQNRRDFYKLHIENAFNTMLHQAQNAMESAQTEMKLKLEHDLEQRRLKVESLIEKNAKMYYKKNSPLVSDDIEMIKSNSLVQ